MTKQLSLVIVAVFLSTLPVYAQDVEKGQVAARIGFSSQIKYEDFTLYDLFLAYPIPELSKRTHRMTVSGRLHATAGRLSAAGKDALLASIGPAIAIKRTGGKIALAAGINLAYVSRHEFGSAHLGGAAQFLSYIGTEIGITGRLGVNYYFQHLSNAGIYDHNPGMNVHSISLSYRF